MTWSHSGNHHRAVATTIPATPSMRTGFEKHQSWIAPTTGVATAIADASGRSSHRVMVPRHFVSRMFAHLLRSNLAVIWSTAPQSEGEQMNAERNDDWRHLDNLPAIQMHDSCIAMVATGQSKISKSVASDPIHQGGIFRFSVTSPKQSS